MPALKKIGAAALSAFGFTSGASAVTANYLIVAGGAGGGWRGGSGAGGLLANTTTLSLTTSYTVTVGAGGTASSANDGISGGNGSNSSFTGLTTKNHIAQLIFSGNPTGTGTLYIDNVYFSKPALANGLTDLSFENTLNIFPNPSNGNITIKFENSISKNISIKVINLLGEVVNATNSYLNESATIDLSNLANGFYYIQINCDGKMATKKIIIKQ